MRIPAFGFVALVCLVACGDHVCTLDMRAAIALEIRDSLSNHPAAHRSSVILEGVGVYDSMFYDMSLNGGDTLAISQLLSPANSQGQPGTYTIRVRHAGYQLWQRHDVEVPGGSCGVGRSPVMITVRLQPLP